MNDQELKANSSRRRITVTVVGILSIVCALAGISGIMARVDTIGPGRDSEDVVVKFIQQQETFRAWIIGAVAAKAAGFGLLLVCGIGLLLARRWARVGSIIYGFCAIAVGVLVECVTYLYVLHPLLFDPMLNQGPQAAIGLSSVLRNMTGEGLGLVYPLLLIILMSRQDVLATCQPR